MSHLENEYYLRLPPGPPLQGDIWTNLPFPNYDPPVCTGILITPRCDLLHDKSPVVNYLPIISMSELLSEEGGVALLEQELSNTEGALRQAGKVLGVFGLLELGVPSSEVLELVQRKFHPAATESAKTQRELDNFRNHLDKLEAVERSLHKPKLDLAVLRSLTSEKARAAYLRKLMGNKEYDFHFLPPCSSLLEHPSIIRLRHIGTCSIQLLKEATLCVSQQQWDIVRTTRKLQEFQICTTKPDRLLRLLSPHLEALMTRFAALFARVGVRDLSRRQIEEFLRVEV